MNSKALPEIIWESVRSEADELLKHESNLQSVIFSTILNHSTISEALFFSLQTEVLDLTYILGEIAIINNRIYKNSLLILVIQDLLAVRDQDPSCTSLLIAFLFRKGFKATFCYRMSHFYWGIKQFTLATIIQARCSELYGVDIHPAAEIGGGLFLHHATGIVIGETCKIGRNCTFLHGVTLGSTGKALTRNRHPKIGNNVLIGCNALLLGDITIGDDCSIGAGSVLLNSLPCGVTAVGNPAIIVGHKKTNFLNSQSTTLLSIGRKSLFDNNDNSYCSSSSSSGTERASHDNNHLRSML